MTELHLLAFPDLQRSFGPVSMEEYMWVVPEF